MSNKCAIRKLTLENAISTSVAQVNPIILAKLFDECPSFETDVELLAYNGDVSGRKGSSIINGSAQITASAPIVTRPEDLDTSNPYFGGYPGATSPRTNNIGAASWDFETSLSVRYPFNSQAAKVQFRWVKYSASATNCTTDSMCTTNPEVCGTSFRDGVDPNQRILVGKCGNLLGYWSSNAICGKTIDQFPVQANQFIDCAQYHQLYRCDEGIKSCYAGDATDTCCGCVNWNSYNISVGQGNDENGNPFTGQCTSSNSNWKNSIVLTSLLWLKDACPTCYVYPFDDKSSTFIAASDKTFATQNMVNYIIMSCPSNVSVAQSPIIDGFRVVKFYNNCDYSVWPAVAGGSQNNKQSTLVSKSTLCTTDSDCYSGASCIKTGAIKQCFWHNPIPSGGNYKLDQAQSLEIKIPIYNNDNPIIWSGVFGFRSLCDNENPTILCTVGDCRKVGNATFTCEPSQGLNQPSTQAEFTMQKFAGDYYDVEIIDGVSTFLQIMPSA